MSEWPARSATCRSAQTPLEERTLWSRWAPEDGEGALRPLRVVIAGTVTTQPLEPYLWISLLGAGWNASVTHAPYHQLYSELLTPGSTLRAEPAPDVVVLLWRMEELLATPLTLLATDPAGARAAMEAELEQFASAIRAFSSTSRATVIVSNPPRPTVRPLGLLDARLAQGIAALHADTLSYWRRLLARLEQVHLLDLDGLQRDFGASRTENPKLWLLAKMPWTEGFNQQVGHRIARLIKATLQPARKVLVLDCDNTLWGGVVTEDGTLGVDVGEDAPGNAYAVFQEYLLALRAQGVLLAVASKNDEPDVWEVFDRHPGMRLKREHLSAARINWLPKSGNLRELAAELNLGLDSLIFLDDSPAECAEVRANTPEVATVHLDGDPSGFIAQVEAAALLDRLSLTAEDSRRAESYQQERAREQLRDAHVSLEEYLANLNLVVRICPATPAHIPRLAQLVNKTNQFNLTTRRRTEAEVVALAADPAWRLFTVHVTDRFGDYGLTGAVFAHLRTDGWELDTLLMSCRVLARGVETAILATVCRAAEEEGASRVYGRYVPTAKNGMVADLYLRHGFEEIDNQLYARSVHPALPIPTHLTLETAPVTLADP